MDQGSSLRDFCSQQCLTFLEMILELDLLIGLSR
jgi:hypothetical protein